MCCKAEDLILMDSEHLCVHAFAGCAHNMWKDGGVTGLFKGNMATMMKVAPQTAIQFAVSAFALHDMANIPTAVLLLE